MKKGDVFVYSSAIEILLKSLSSFVYKELVIHPTFIYDADV
jgi:hypothetical protein